MVFVVRDAGIVSGDRFHPRVPERHGDGDAVGLGGGSQVPALAPACQIESEAQHPVDPEAGHHGFLDDDLAIGAGEHVAAHRRVFALGVLAHYPEVDIPRLAAHQRAGHAGHQPHRTQVDILIVFAAELQQRAPQRHVIGHRIRPADRAEEDRVGPPDPLFPVFGHHPAVLRIVVAVGKIMPLLLDGEAIARGGGFQHANALGHHFLADAIAGDDGNGVAAVAGHARVLSPGLRRSCRPWRRAVRPVAGGAVPPSCLPP